MIGQVEYKIGIWLLYWCLNKSGSNVNWKYLLQNILRSENNNVKFRRQGGYIEIFICRYIKIPGCIGEYILYTLMLVMFRVVKSIFISENWDIIGFIFMWRNRRIYKIIWIFIKLYRNY